MKTTITNMSILKKIIGFKNPTNLRRDYTSITAAVVGAVVIFAQGIPQDGTPTVENNSNTALETKIGSNTDSTKTLPQARTLTNTEGKSIEGTVLSKNDETKTISFSRADGKTFDIPYNKISKEDTEWLATVENKKLRIFYFNDRFGDIENKPNLYIPGKNVVRQNIKIMENLGFEVSTCIMKSDHQGVPRVDTEKLNIQEILTADIIYLSGLWEHHTDRARILKQYKGVVAMPRGSPWLKKWEVDDSITDDEYQEIFLGEKQIWKKIGRHEDENFIFYAGGNPKTDESIIKRLLRAKEMTKKYKPTTPIN